MKGKNRQPQYFSNKQLPKKQLKNRRDADKLMDNTYRLNKLLTYTVLHFKFGFGKKRLARFKYHFEDLLDSIQQGYVSVDDLNKDLEEHTGEKIFL